MKEVVVPVRRALADMRAGMADPALMKKYRLTHRGLADLRRQLIAAGMLEEVAGSYCVPATRKMLLSHVVSDIRSGMSLSSMVEKYTLSAAGLDMLLRQLLAGRHVAQKELDRIVEESDRTGAAITFRKFPRYQPPLMLEVLTGVMTSPGWVVDISASGLRVCGVVPPPAHMIKIVVLGDEFGEFEPFEFFGECKWTVTDPQSDFEAGFEIIKISSIDLRVLLRTLEDCRFDLRNPTR